jgi:Spy/CpxP family protein refolding chaperone
MISLISQRIALFALMFVLTAGAVWAQDDNGRDGGKPPGSATGASFDECLGRLELNADQRAAIGTIKEESAAFVRTTMQQIEELSRLLRAAREAGNREEIARLENAIGEKKNSLASAQERANNAIVGHLTAEQQTALRACMSGTTGGGGGNTGGEKHSLEDCLKTIRLTDAQASQIATLREAATASMRETNGQIEELNGLLRAAREAGNREEIARLENAIGEKKHSLEAAQERLNNAIIGVLTAEQQAALRLCMTGEGGTGGGGNGGGGNGGGTIGSSLDDCLKNVHLTDGQAAQIARLKEAAGAAIREINASIEELSRALRAAHEAGNEREVARIEGELAQKKQALASLQERLNNDIMAILSPEQQAALRDCMNHKEGGDGDKGHGERDGDRHQKKDCLENILTDGQQEQIRNLTASFKEDNAALMQEIRGLYAELRTARREHNADAVAALIAKIREKMATLKAAQAAFRDDVLALLTEEQRAALLDCREGRDGGHKGPGRANTLELPELK